MRYRLAIASAAASVLLQGCCASRESTAADPERGGPSIAHEEREPPVQPIVSTRTPTSVSAQDVMLQTSDRIPVTEEVVARMAASFASTPVLHVKTRNRHRGTEYRGNSWLKTGKARGEVRTDGKLAFATFTDRRRVQEYVPKVKFANGTEAERVLIEYDKGANDGGWYRLVDFAFACGPGACASDAFLADRRPSLPELFRGNMQGSKMTETELDGRPCYWYHMEAVVGEDKITWDLYVDKVTCEPVRQASLIVQGDKVKKDEVFDYTFEHLPDDAAFQWELDLANLKD